MIQKNELSSRGAKDLLPEIMGNKIINVKSLAESKGLIQKNDVEALKKIVEEVSKENETQWNDFKNGNEKLLMFFVGKCMAKSKGSGNPQMFQEILKTAVSQ
jgi:aspartyl-tRNA(Asn)/glutamyl-tRNA(Gln) amidotransferase subunit B